MNVYQIEITTVSELCVATGHSIPGLVDTEVAHHHGFPIIPAKRIKGALHGVGRELVDWGLIDERELEQLFGTTGDYKSSGLQLFDAELQAVSINGECGEKDLQHVGDLKQVVAAFRTTEPEEVLEQFTMIRSQTAIEENVAKHTSLRTIRTVNKGTVFSSRVILEDTANLETLRKCVQGLRALGLGRTRGLGEVVCEINKGEADNVNERTVETEELAFDLTLEQPLLIAGSKGLYHSSEDWIPGRTLLGALAGMYIQDHQLGVDAHKDETFSRIFLNGGVTFHYAYPKIDGKVFTPCPAHLQQDKLAKTIVYDISQEISQGKGVPRSLKALIHIEDQMVLTHEPNKEIRMHHARPKDRGIGRAMGDTGGRSRKDQGQFFQYTALSQGQTFSGSWKGPKEDIARLVACMKKRNWQLRLGRSRTAEYGTVRMTLNDKPLQPTRRTVDTDWVALVLLTPYIGTNDYGVATSDPTYFQKELEIHLKDALEIKRKFLKQTMVSGFHAKWGMPKQQLAALDAGTVFIVKNNRQDWQSIEHASWGMDTGAGYGRIMVTPINSTQSEYEKRVMEIGQTNELKRDHTFVEFLMRKMNDAKKNQAELQAGRNKAANVENKRLTGQTVVHRMDRLFKGNKIQELNKIPEGDIRKQIYDDCKNQSEQFRKGYFQALLLKIRGEKND
ncbi:CRISPR-associated protein Csx10 [Alkalihalobacillus xiaoxiensis]|uniref:CRISPR-associated protein Csx10 n=1 Tax=Shouchella xiaoxiensis TaxID=766895 RepID=A0ABS2SU93_9BACI|nr:RAMP superfamily CRISPR-associated protein [Shouchella xiaoxiensis]MBM7839103.1 CRISPR-associated protein Csx10 [Shouchella xiaoxiensis]